MTVVGYYLSGTGGGDSAVSYCHTASGLSGVVKEGVRTFSVLSTDKYETVSP